LCDDFFNAILSSLFSLGRVNSISKPATLAGSQVVPDFADLKSRKPACRLVTSESKLKRERHAETDDNLTPRPQPKLKQRISHAIAGKICKAWIAMPWGNLVTPWSPTTSGEWLAAIW
jgi:hypothetical protein